MLVRCPAKINLFLEVVGKRPDGYHELITVMAPISLADTLEMTAARRDALIVSPRDAAPADASNTVMKAIAALRGRASVPPVRIKLTKRVPSAAGLGGGSSDAAGAIRAANRLFKLRLSVEDESAVLAKVGSDTSFFARESWAVCTGRGEVVTPIKGRALNLVIVAPAYDNPTGEIFKRHASTGDRRGVDSFVDALHGRKSIAPQMFNRLEAAAFAFRPELAALKRAMTELPFEAVMMTGSGSALFGLCTDARTQRSLASTCRERRWGRVFAATTQA